MGGEGGLLSCGLLREAVLVLFGAGPRRLWTKARRSWFAQQSGQVRAWEERHGKRQDQEISRAGERVCLVEDQLPINSQGPTFFLLSEMNPARPYTKYEGEIMVMKPASYPLRHGSERDRG